MRVLYRIFADWIRSIALVKNIVMNKKRNTKIDKSQKISLAEEIAALSPKDCKKFAKKAVKHAFLYPREDVWLFCPSVNRD